MKREEVEERRQEERGRGRERGSIILHNNFITFSFEDGKNAEKEK